MGPIIGETPFTIKGKSKATQPKPDTSPRAHGTIRISLPAKVAYQPDALKKNIAALMERIGCPHCFSGADCWFTVERDFLVDPANTIAALVSGPRPEPWFQSSTVVASLDRAVRHDLDAVFKAVDKVIGTIGACPCHSGVDVLYLNELKVIGVNAKIEAQQYGG
jgi:hypothetical protein